MVKYADETYSFRLVAQEEEGRGGTLSECGSTASSSRHKQRIDSLFRDRRPRPAPTPTTLPLHPVRAELERMFGGRDQRQRAFQDVRATVQAQIERLFADASSTPLIPRKDRPPLPTLSPSAAPPTIRPATLTPHYVPALPDPPHPFDTPSPPTHTPSPPPHTPSPPPQAPPLTPPRNTPSPPVADLRYAVDYLGAAVVEGRAGSLAALQEPLRDLYYQYSAAQRPGAGHLHITAEGLAVTQEDGRRLLDNPFPTIAVWAAVKLVTRRASPVTPATTPYSYAFLPLISDPEAQDKGDLFHPLHVPQPTLLAGRAHHPPMLACVMRRAGVPRLLECHAFVCRSAEDAIVIAANLYQALVRGMGGSDAPSDTYSDVPHHDARAMFSDSEAVPVRPPRRKRASRRGAPPGNLRRAASEDMLGGGRHPRGSQGGLRRSVSEREGLGGLGLGSCGGSGDVYTRVALPRSRSFMSVSEKYCLTDLVPDTARDKAADEVLRQVVTPRGMSYSEMAPGQRQALLRVALTLSRDEMYQRSKSILRQQTHGSLSEDEWSSSRLGSMLRATKRSFSRLGSRASTLQSAYLRDKKLPVRRLAGPAKGRHAPARVGSRNGAPKTPMPRRGTSRSGGDQSCSECGYDSECSSKCYCSLPRRGGQGGCKTSGGEGSSGDSGGPQLTCDCDTESCAESEKCYCSLRRVRQDGLRLYAIDLDSETDAASGVAPPHSPSSLCNGRSASRAASWRRAGSTGSVSGSSPGTVTPQRRSPASSRSSDSEGPRRTPTLVSPRRRRRNLSGSLGSSGSKGSSRGSSRGSSQGSASKILLVSAVDPSGRVVYRGASQRQQHHRQDGDTASILSMKKTAEIAALFSELKLSQTTDLLHHHPDHDHDHHDHHDHEDDDFSMTANNSFLFSDNIETSLGYLP